ncbi:MAG TPA: TatD family deoxyribonuclease [Halieaceae bacterium]|nr:TatD family deoxyribonuclease [Halieaceae bacterium]
MSKKQRRAIPRFATPIVETHCHLDYLGEDALAETLAAAADVGIERVVTIAVAPDNLATVRRIAEADARVWCTQGIHPHEAGSYDASVEAAIREGAAHPRVVAIGEIGLDYYYDHADRGAQRDAFARQLALAAELALPVVIHSRDADEDTEAILAEHLPAFSRAGLASPGVIHSFTSGQGLAEFALAAGFYLGFNGITTFRNADNVRAIVELTPARQLLLETDAPYLTPVPYRGTTNAPCYLPFVAEQIAGLKGLPVEELLAIARRSSYALFFPGDAPALAA